jgi:HPt (histidine-containing phosphotransfer) domain-containing protein
MITDLRYLEDMTEGDKRLIMELIGIFSTQVEEYSRQMATLLKEKNWSELSKLAHKAKSSVAIMGMKDLSQELKKLEILADKEEKTETFASYIEHFTTECAKALSELQNYK